MLHATDVHIASGEGSLVNNGNDTWTYTPKIYDDTEVSFDYQITNGTLSATGQAKMDTSAQSAPAIGSPGDDTFTAVTGNSSYEGGLGRDTIIFDFKLVDAQVSYVGNAIIIDGPSSHTVLNGFEAFQFADGTVDNKDNSPLIDDLF